MEIPDSPVKSTPHKKRTRDAASSLLNDEGSGIVVDSENRNKKSNTREVNAKDIDSQFILDDLSNSENKVNMQATSLQLSSSYSPSFTASETSKVESCENKSLSGKSSDDNIEDVVKSLETLIKSDPEMNKIVILYHLLDVSTCFYFKHGNRGTKGVELTLVQKMIKSLNPHIDCSDDAIQRIEAVAPHLIKISQNLPVLTKKTIIENYASSSINPQTCIIFNEIKGTSPKDTLKRKRALMELLLSKKENNPPLQLQAVIVNTPPAPTIHEAMEPTQMLKYIGNAPFNPESVLSLIQGSSFYRCQIVFSHITKEKKSESDPIDSIEFHPNVKLALERKGITHLFKHQKKAILGLIDEERDIVISTSTSSGKSLVFNIPVLHSMYEQQADSAFSSSSSRSFSQKLEKCRAIYIFPTKALAQDQLRSLKEYIGDDKIIVNTFDGDTPFKDRNAIRSNSDIIITNPDMLHMSILPDHINWGTFLANLRYIVIDEAHSLSGIFGSHVSCIIRRFLRIVHFHQRIHVRNSKKRVQIVLCSATIGNPVGLFHSLVPKTDDTEPLLIDDSDNTAPQGERYFVLWNPPYRDSLATPVVFREDSVLSEKNIALLGQKQVENREKKSSVYEAAQIFAFLVANGIRTLCFGKSRIQTELVLKYSRKILSDIHNRRDLVNRVSVYRGGYMAEERRRMEKNLFSGMILGVCATSALELGVDIGSLDAVITIGYPGSQSSLFQQIGRAGRSGRSCLSIMVLFDGPLDAWFMKNPEKLLSKSSVEDAILNPSNHHILRAHLLCAAKELPFYMNTDGDVADFETYFSFPASTQKHNSGSALSQKPAAYEQLSLLEAEDLLSKVKIDIRDPLFQLKEGFKISIHPKIQQPWNTISIRACDPITFDLIDSDTDRVMESIEWSRAYYTHYPGAVTLHQGQNYIVDALNIEKKEIRCHQADIRYVTNVSYSTDMTITRIMERSEQVSEGSLGNIHIKSQLLNYEKFLIETNQSLGSVSLNVPSRDWDTIGMWIDLTPSIIDKIKSLALDLGSGVHAVGHMLKKMLPLFAFTKSSDVDCQHSFVVGEIHKASRITLFDKIPGGCGLSEAGFLQLGKLLGVCHEVITSCGCSSPSGCPLCVLDLQCPCQNQNISKDAAKVLIEQILNYPLNQSQTINQVNSSNVLTSTVDQSDSSHFGNSIDSIEMSSALSQSMSNARFNGDAKVYGFTAEQTKWNEHV